MWVLFHTLFSEDSSRVSKFYDGKSPLPLYPAALDTYLPGCSYNFALVGKQE